jgi:hypothetical protein
MLVLSIANKLSGAVAGDSFARLVFFILIHLLYLKIIIKKLIVVE